MFLNISLKFPAIVISFIGHLKSPFSIRKPSTKYDISPVRPPRKWIPPSALLFSTTPAIVVIISSKDQKNCIDAKNIIESIVRDPEVGMIFEGEVKRIMNFGAFIEFSPGREALCHISELAYERTNKVEDILNIGDKTKVKIINVDDMKRIDVSLKALQKPPEGWVEPPKKDIDKACS